MAQVEVLLHLHRSPGRAWRPGELAETLPFGTMECARHLAALETHGLAAEDPANRGGYVYAPTSEALAAAVDNLRVAYDTRPVTLVKALYSRPAPAVRAFADAFRIRKPGD